ncbi:MAG: aminoglycoside phosphotransferase family protein [Holosporales bacterium]|jgi:aminoglycoside/choline kinase family phosphotransferase
MTPDRLAAARDFLARQGEVAATLDSLPADASFRCYHRLRGRGLLLMDAPPEKETVTPFIQVAEILHSYGLGAPKILAADAGQGFVLLEDFGEATFTRLLAADPDQEADLYTLALDTLAALHAASKGQALNVPPYDVATLAREANLVVEWPKPLSLEAQQEYAALWLPLLEELAAYQPQVLVLRDFHVDNLMLRGGVAGQGRCGLLDFQDALAGHPAYDVVSLLQDVRREVSSDVVRQGLEGWLARYPQAERAALRRAYHLLGAQRALKIVGIFHRLHIRDHKPRYQAFLPRTWRLVGENVAAEASLAALGGFLKAHFPEGIPS